MLMVHAQLLTQLVNNYCKGAGLSVRHTRVVANMTARLYALTEEGIDKTVVVDADVALYACEVVW